MGSRKKAAAGGVAVMEGAEESRTKTAARIDGITSYAVERVAVAYIVDAGNHRTPERNGIDELRESIKQVGILQPLVVRKMAGGHFEIVAGRRRLSAARGLGLEVVPAIVREMTDEEANVAAVIENVQREDVHPIEEAEAYAELAKRFGYEAKEIAARMGKPIAYVRQRYVLASIPKEARAACLKGEISVHGAFLIGRIPDEARRAAVTKEVLSKSWNKDDDAIARIVHQSMNDLSSAPFDVTDLTLVPAAGACGVCPYRTGNANDLFGDVQGKDVCTRPSCFAEKTAAAWARLSAGAKEKGLRILTVAEAKKVFPYEHGEGPAERTGFVLASEKPYEFGGQQTWKKIAGAGAPPVVIAQHPYSGRAVELYDVGELRTALKRVGVTSKAAREGKGGASKAEKQHRMEAAISKAGDRAVMRAVVDVLERRPVTSVAVWQVLASAFTFEGQPCDEIVRMLGLEMTDAEKKKGRMDQPSRQDLVERWANGLKTVDDLRSFTFVGAVTHLGATWRGDELLKKAAKIVGVDCAAIERKVRAEMVKKVEATKVAKKAAGASKKAKRAKA